MKFPLTHRFPAIQKILFGQNNKNIFLFLGVLFPNIIAALLEGLSFALILLSLNAFGHVTTEPPTGHAFLTFLPTDNPQRAFILCIGLAVLSQLCRSVFMYIGQTVALFLGVRMQIEGQQKVYSQIFRLSFSCVNRYKSGELLEYSRIPSLLITALMSPLNQLLISFFTIIASVGMMIFISVPLTLLAILAFGLLIFSQKIIIRKISKVSQSLTSHMIDFSKHIVQSLQALRIIHTFQRQTHVRQTIQSTLDQVAATTKRLNLWSQSITPLNEMLGILIVGIFLVTGEWLIGNSNEGTLPMLLTFTVIIHRLSARLRVFLESIGSVAYNWGQMIKLEEILNDADKEFIPIGPIHKVEFKQKISFHDVSLQYPSTNMPSLRYLNLEISKGSTTAFVGASGAGKSSIMDLMLRLYDPTGGEILIDNISLSQIDLGSWRLKLGVVSQDTFIFNSSIEENILFGLLGASAQEVLDAAKMAGAHKFISQLPDGYQTIVGERGYRLSGGERQRIAMARALIRKPEILILDEATSSLDSESEQLIQSALNKLSREKTIIIVAHRLSTICHADQIVVIDQGKLVEIGTHQELLSKNGSYAKFWNIQARGLTNESAIHS